MLQTTINRTVLAFVAAAALASALPAQCEDWPDFLSYPTLEDVTRCLAAGADPNAREPDRLTDRPPFRGQKLKPIRHQGSTRLLSEVRYGIRKESAAIVEALLAAGADPNARVDDETALHIVMWALGHSLRRQDSPESPAVAVIKALVAAGADPDAHAPGKGTVWGLLGSLPEPLQSTIEQLLRR